MTFWTFERSFKGFWTFSPFWILPSSESEHFVWMEVIVDVWPSLQANYLLHNSTHILSPNVNNKYLNFPKPPCCICDAKYKSDVTSCIRKIVIKPMERLKINYKLLFLFRNCVDGIISRRWARVKYGIRCTVDCSWMTPCKGRSVKMKCKR